MKNIIFHVILLIALCGSASRGHAQSATAPVDNADEQRLINQASIEMCRRLELENQKRPLTNLTQVEAEQLFGRLFIQAAGNNEELADLLIRLGNQNTEEAGKIGVRIGTILIRDCPVSKPMLMLLAGEQMSRQHPLSRRETKVLQPIATAMCRDLQPRVAELQTLPPTQRLPILTQAFEANFELYSKQLRRLYGANIFFNQEALRMVGVKISALITPQCPIVAGLFVDIE